MPRRYPTMENEIQLIINNTNELIHRLETEGIALSPQELEGLEVAAAKLFEIKAYNSFAPGEYDIYNSQDFN